MEKNDTSTQFDDTKGFSVLRVLKDNSYEIQQNDFCSFSIHLLCYQNVNLDTNFSYVSRMVHPMVFILSILLQILFQLPSSTTSKTLEYYHQLRPLLINFIIVTATEPLPQTQDTAVATLYRFS